MTKQKRAGGGSNSFPPPALGPLTPIPLTENVTRPTDTPLSPDDTPGHRRIPCTEALDMIGDYLSHELTAVRKDAFVNHMRTCEACHGKLLTIEIQLHLAAAENKGG